MTSSNLAVELGPLRLKNPVMTASGTFGYGREFSPYLDLNRLGAIVVKGLSLSPSKGNPPPRIVETASGMLNAIGLENVGVSEFVTKKAPYLETLATPVIANIYGTCFEDYAAVAERLRAVDGVAGIEINISCPNVKKGGLAFGTDPLSAYQVTSLVRKQYDKFLMVKLSPNVTDITELAKSVEDAGADAVSLINTLTGMAIDIASRRPKLANVIGGLSGPAIKPVALRMVWQVANAVKIPVVGIGGIMSADDALEFLIAGATAFQVGTANFINPAVTEDIVKGLGQFLKDQQIDSIRELIGTLSVD